MKIPSFKPNTTMPDLVPYRAGQVNQTATQYDVNSYAASDADFKKRHKPIVSAEKALEQSVAKDWTGDTTLMPQMQSEFMRSGLEGALDTFGDTGPTLAPNSAGEAKVARNLGLDIMQFQDRNRQNRERSLSMAEQIFPRRQFGITGEDAGILSMLNTQGQNSWNQAWYGDQIQQQQLNHRIGVENMRAEQGQENANAAAGAQADASKKQAMIGGAAIAGIALIAL